MKDKHLDILTGIILGVVVSLYFPVGVEYKGFMVLLALILGLRLVVTK